MYLLYLHLFIITWTFETAGEALFLVASVSYFVCLFVCYQYYDETVIAIVLKLSGWANILIILLTLIFEPNWLPVWLSGKTMVSINVVTVRNAQLVPGWVTVFGRVNHLGTRPGTQVYSAWAIPLWIGRWVTSESWGSKQARRVIHPWSCGVGWWSDSAY